MAPMLGAGGQGGAEATGRPGLLRHCPVLLSAPAGSSSSPSRPTYPGAGAECPLCSLLPPGRFGPPTLTPGPRRPKGQRESRPVGGRLWVIKVTAARKPPWDALGDTAGGGGVF